MPPPGRGRGRGHGPGPHRPHPHRPHAHPHPHPVPPPAQPRPGAVAAAVGAGIVAGAAVGAAAAHNHGHGGGAVAAGPVFERLYHWEDGATVVIQHSLGKYLRVAGNDHTKLDYEGGTGDLARWKVHMHEGGTVLQLESLKTGKMLRMQPNGNDFDVNGIHKGPNTYFLIEKKSTGVAFLKTKKTYHNNQHAYLAVMHGHLAQKRLTFYVQGKAREWERPYLFAQKNIVVIQHSQGFKHLRVHPDNTHKVDGDGGTGKYARWEADPDHQNNTVRFKSVHTGGYLRIHGNGDVLEANGKGGKFTIFKVHHIGEDKNYVKLESLAHPGKFVAVGKDGARVGVGGHFCALTIYRE